MVEGEAFVWHALVVNRMSAILLTKGLKINLEILQNSKRL